ncbi:hypothetical protein [Rhizobium sp. EC-SD404]|uniref:hypothetical protein n=1 Tax=Rhizobium sp. EC-SD404 TaxID=2038389 RepID=UPI0012521625|nr:hypothetical protein [Rhizobium sp. EC-SD404]VVT02973.1 conserved exported hypothetical protein [Rhizobium sp. EC-SD404]
MTRMISALAVTGSIVAAGTAHAAIPLLNATCPGSIEVHADQGGPVYINGTEAKLNVFNAEYYEASHDHVTISIMISPDGTPSLSYTARGGVNGVCTLR